MLGISITPVHPFSSKSSGYFPPNVNSNTEPFSSMFFCVPPRGAKVTSTRGQWV